MLGVAVALTMVGCSGASDETRRIAGWGGDDAGTEGGIPSGPCGGYLCGYHEECWKGTLCVAKSVKIPQGYSIDATEVTRWQYERWLATNPSTSGQDAWCAFNTDFHPDSDCMTCGGVYQDTDYGKHPQVCVDWCDAYA